MRLMVAAFYIVLFCSAANATEFWNCDYVSPTTNEPKKKVFWLEPPDVVTNGDAGRQDRFKILFNSDDGLVGAIGIAGMDNNVPKVVGGLVLISKKTNEFMLTAVIIGEDKQLPPIHGACTHSQ